MAIWEIGVAERAVGWVERVDVLAPEETAAGATGTAAAVAVEVGETAVRALMAQAA